MPRKSNQFVLQPTTSKVRNNTNRKYPRKLVRKAIIPVIQSVRAAVRPNKRRRARTQLNRSTSAIGSQGLMVSLPVQESMQFGKSTFRITGTASKMADYDATSSLRIQGSGMLASVVSTAAPGTGAFNVSVTHSTVYWYPITPNNLDSRIGYFETIYSYYIIREIKIQYIPSVGTNTTGLVALGLSTNFDDILQLPTPQLYQVMEYDSTLLTPVWAAASLEAKDAGAKGFSTNPDADGLMSYQYLLGGTTAGVPSTAGTYGLLHATFVIDFYQPRPFESLVSVSSKPKITILEESDEDIIAQMVKSKLDFKKSQLKLTQ